ncbi:MAG: class F sortase, partial [Candidatus Saccharimonadales bacterium]
MKPWRAKQYRINLSRTRKLVITARRFKTAKANRSKSFRQMVIPISSASGSVKEIAFRLETTSRKKVKAVSVWRLKTAMPFVLILAGLAGVGVFGSQIVYGKQLEPAKTFSTKPAPDVNKTIESLPRSLPTHIAIPSVNIDADIISVGQNSSGGIQMPPILAAHTAGWYEYSPTPGQIGPSVIVGHVDNYQTISVFWRLRYVKPGDIITVNRADGSAVKFKVTALKQFSQANFPTQQVYGNINYPGLRLITCGGIFDHQTGEYDQNTVVYA